MPSLHLHERNGRDRVIHRPGLYDLMIGLLGRRGHRLRASIADRLKVGPGDRVPDVGCGTGRLVLWSSPNVSVRPDPWTGLTLPRRW
jgi:hypothetical protein